LIAVLSALRRASICANCVSTGIARSVITPPSSPSSCHLPPSFTYSWPHYRFFFSFTAASHGTSFMLLSRWLTALFICPPLASVYCQMPMATSSSFVINSQLRRGSSSVPSSPPSPRYPPVFHCFIPPLLIVVCLPLTISNVTPYCLPQQ
jgi:hypothetical protein